MLTKFTVLETDPNTLDIELLPEQMGEYEEKCKICRNLKGRRIVDFLLANNIAGKKVADYCNKYKLYEPPLNETNVGGHRKNHLKIDGRTKQSLARVETEVVKAADIQSVYEQLKTITDEQISFEMLRKAVAPYYTKNGKIPQLREAVALYKAIQEKEAVVSRDKFLTEFFKTAQATPIRDGKIKRSIKIKPLEGVEVIQSVES